MRVTARSRAKAALIPWGTVIFVGLWIWAIWSCAEHWRGNPNYSYGWVVPVLALGFGLRRYFLTASREPPAVETETGPSWSWALLFAVVSAVAVFALEFARQIVWHPQIVLSLICGSAIVFSLGLFWNRGGSRLLRAEVFPVLFFLTAVPWPARMEQPITSSLMRWVVSATAELLHWIGVEAQTSGGAIALRSGLVGITEACSGIRSLQAGIMFGLALGEWFLLRPARRIFLLAFAVGAALLTNLARTLALALQAERHGVASVEEVHDLIGNITITALIVAIWIVGKLLESRRSASPLLSLQELKRRASELCHRVLRSGRASLAPAAIACFLALISARVLYGVMEARDQTQLAPFFTVQADENAGDRFVPVPKEIWNELRPSSGEYIRREAPDLPRGAADFYHFFWKPSPWNRFALVHRPDICMPGVGWESTGPPDAYEIDFEGRKVRFYAFRFQRGDYRALQMWGVWRNGEPVSLDYKPAQVFGVAAPRAGLQLEGKRRSATEIVACSLFSAENEPSAETAVALLQALFKYKPR